MEDVLPPLTKRPRQVLSRAAAPALTATAFASDQLTTRVLPSVTAICRDDWNRLFPGAGEDWDYFHACELMSPEHFSLAALAAYHRETLVGAAPIFRMNFRLDMALGARIQRIGDWLDRRVPWLVNMPILGLGSPLADECPLGFLPGLNAADKAVVLEALLRGLSEHAANCGISVLTLKDVTDKDARWGNEALTKAGYARTASLPIAAVDLPFKEEKQFFANLPAKRRGDLRRNLRSASLFSVEFRDSIEDVHDEMIALYHQTRSRRNANYQSFDEVPSSYFREVMQRLPGKAQVVLFRAGKELVGFAFFLRGENKVTFKFIGMQYPLALEHHLYFIIWMTMVRYCLANGISCMQAGQTTYRVKVRLGAQLHRSWVYFKHRGPVIGRLFRAVAPLITFDSLDPDLAELGGEAPYHCDG